MPGRYGIKNTLAIRHGSLNCGHGRSQIREWVNPAIDSDALANQITMAGLGVYGVEPVAGSFHGVVVGEVVGLWYAR